MFLIREEKRSFLEKVRKVLNVKINLMVGLFSFFFDYCFLQENLNGKVPGKKVRRFQLICHV